MSFYSVCGLNFDSTEPFPELVPLDKSQISGEHIKLRRVPQLSEVGAVVRSAVSWTTPEGGEHLSSTKTEKGYVLRFAQLADFFINQTSGVISFCSRPDTPPDSIRHLFLDGVVPLLLSLGGCGILHASAVLTPYGVGAFLGETGAGKSTLAGSFQHLGCAIVSDDCLVLDKDEHGFYARPSYPGVRLREDSLSHLAVKGTATLSVAHYNSKRRLNSVPFAGQPHPIKAIYCLQRVNQVQRGMPESVVETLSGHHRLIEVLRYLYCLDPYDPDMLVKQFKLLESLVSVVPVFHLAIPDGFRHLSRVCENVLAHMREMEQGQQKGDPLQA